MSPPDAHGKNLLPFVIHWIGMLMHVIVINVALFICSCSSWTCSNRILIFCSFLTLNFQHANCLIGGLLHVVESCCYVLLGNCSAHVSLACHFITFQNSMYILCLLFIILPLCENITILLSLTSDISIKLRKSYPKFYDSLDYNYHGYLFHFNFR